MGTLFSTLWIGTSGLQASQVQMDVTGHNISNVNTEGFSRQRANLVDRLSIHFPFGEIGRGVSIGNIERIRDTFLDTIYRTHVPDLGESEVLAEYYTRLEDLFLEPTEYGIGVRINYFFDALNDFANAVEEIPVRQSVLSEGQALASTLNEVADRLYKLRTNANEEVGSLVPEINALAEGIARLNVQIRDTELGGLRTANDLRDERDRQMDKLAKLINISYRERTDGQIDVLVSGDVLVNGGEVEYMEAVTNPLLDPERFDLVEVRFADTGRLVEVKSGALRGALDARDEAITDVDTRFDEIAATIIEQINKIHAAGNGLSNLSGTISSGIRTGDAVTPLVSAGLPFGIDTTPPNNTFEVDVYDPTGAIIETATITITNATTLTDLANDLNAMANISASVNATTGDTLDVSVGGGNTFTFTNDNSGVLAAIGLNSFFTGYDARTIGVNQDLVDNPEWLSSGYSLDPLNTGDNQAALDMADVRNGLFLDSNSATINDAYEAAVVAIGIDSRANTQTRDLEDQFVQNFDLRRQEISGVSLDEETVRLIQFQRAYEGNARVISTVNAMLEVLVNLGR